jgi:hypothetical protein
MSADTTIAIAIRHPIGIYIVKGVPTLASSFSGILGIEAFTPQRVLPIGHNFQMFGAHTSSIAA